MFNAIHLFSKAAKSSTNKMVDRRPKSTAQNHIISLRFLHCIFVVCPVNPYLLDKRIYTRPCTHTFPNTGHPFQLVIFLLIPFSHLTTKKTSTTSSTKHSIHQPSPFYLQGRIAGMCYPKPLQYTIRVLEQRHSRDQHAYAQNQGRYGKSKQAHRLARLASLSNNECLSKTDTTRTPCH